jgi:hypothetical protein
VVVSDEDVRVDEEYEEELEVELRRATGATETAFLVRQPMSAGAYTGVTASMEPIDARFDGLEWYEVTPRDELVRLLMSPRGKRAEITTNRGIAADIVDVVADFLDSDAISENRAAGLLREQRS